MTQTQAASAFISRSIGLPSAHIVENSASFGETLSEIRQDLPSYREVADALEALELLSQGKAVFYAERGVKLDPRMETLVTDYASGLASFAAPDGLRSRTFDPTKAALAILITRSALEKSYSELMQYFGVVASI
jgi:hypothetical protein